MLENLSKGVEMRKSSVGACPQQKSRVEVYPQQKSNKERVTLQKIILNEKNKK